MKRNPIFKTNQFPVQLYFFLYKFCCIVAGLIIIYWGYKLFIAGIFNKSGELTGTWNNASLIIKKAAPGTYFVLFGSIIISLTVFKGFNSNEFESKSVLKDDSVCSHKIDTVKFKDSIIIK